MADVSKLYSFNGTEQELQDAQARSSISGFSSTAQLVNKIYPVGSIYISVSSTNPGTVMSGTTWTRIKDRMLLGAGDTYTAGNTGGSATHTLTTAEMPSHSHTFTGSAATTGGISANHTHSGTTGNQSANHTHTGTSGNPNQNHTHGTKAHAHTYKVHSVGYYGGTDLRGPGTKTGTDGSTNAATGTTGTVSAWHTHTTTFGNQSAGHTHSLTTGGISANHTHSFTGKGTVGNNGSGTAFNIMPPYLAAYVWKRTA